MRLPAPAPGLPGPLLSLLDRFLCGVGRHRWALAGYAPYTVAGRPHPYTVERWCRCVACDELRMDLIPREDVG